MNIPASFKAAQQKAFQDKSIMIRPAVEVTGSLGSVTVDAGASIGTVLASVQYISDAIFAQEWGLTVAQDAVMTRSTSCQLFKGDFVQYNGTVFRVIEAPVHDSHWRWLLKATDKAVV